jgi:uncharacterized Fe-S cluster protein YjdI
MITQKDFHLLAEWYGIFKREEAETQFFELAKKMAIGYAKFIVDAKVICVDGEWHVYEQNERRFIWVRPEQLFELYQQSNP